MPENQRTIRKLSAILSADVKGYSRLMSDDESHTIETLKKYRKVMSEIILQHTGRVVDAPGDNLLAEFSRAVDAVRCAVEIQKTLKEKNEILPEEKRLKFRIGVNIGDIIQDGGNLYGEGVNIAARIEGLACAGGICISRNVYDHVKNKLNLGYEYIGEHSVKNIKDPVWIYKLLIADEDAGKLIGVKPKRARKKWLVPAVAVAAVIVTSIIWHFVQSAYRPEFEPASIEKMAYPLPDKPSIAVLPFDNMSGEPEQEFFSDGLSEEIITALSKSSQIFVIARNSSFTYKGKPVKVQQVAEELGVRYVLEGSVRKDQERVRITAQLIDAVKGVHLWAERYDRELNDIFAIQDDITKQIIAALHIKLTTGEDARLESRYTNNLQAYLKLLEGIAFWSRFNKDDNTFARRLFEESIALDANYLNAYISLAWTYLLDAAYGWSESRSKSVETAYELVQKALSIDESFPGTYSALGSIHVHKGEYEKAVVLRQKAAALEPHSAYYRGLLGTAYLLAGDRIDEAIAELKLAYRLDPFPPSWIFHYLGTAYRVKGEYEKAVEFFKKAISKTPDYWLSHLGLSASYGLTGREKEARAAAAEVLRIDPNFSMEKIMTPFRNKADKERTLDVLRKAGLPE